jgi:hypothetical protein
MDCSPTICRLSLIRINRQKTLDNAGSYTFCTSFKNWIWSKERICSFYCFSEASVLFESYLDKSIYSNIFCMERMWQRAVFVHNKQGAHKGSAPCAHSTFLCSLFVTQPRSAIHVPDGVVSSTMDLHRGYCFHHSREPLRAWSALATARCGCAPANAICSR